MTTRRIIANILTGLILLLAVVVLVWIQIDERASRDRHGWETHLGNRFEQNIPSGGETK